MDCFGPCTTYRAAPNQLTMPLYNLPFNRLFKRNLKNSQKQFLVDAPMTMQQNSMIQWFFHLHKDSLSKYVDCFHIEWNNLKNSTYL